MTSGPMATERHLSVSCGAALAALLLCAGADLARGAEQVTAEQLKAKMDGLVADIRKEQAASGAWGSDPILGRQQWVIGQTALAVLALSSAGVPSDDPAVTKGAKYLADHEAGSVYGAALRIMALEAVNPKLYQEDIAKEAGYLMKAQLREGGWSYVDVVTRPDNSNSQFAILGLQSAARCGVRVPENVWAAARTYFARGQHADHGWGYIQGDAASYGSMSVAGIASLYVCNVRLHVAKGDCKTYDEEYERRVDAGLKWLAQHFTVEENPGSNMWKFYYLYGLERAGVISARRYIGDHDWYLEGANHLVLDPRAFGVLEDMAGPLVRKCFTLLFLARGNSPVLLHKAQWAGGWAGHRYDAKFLVEDFGDMLGQRLTWQIMPLTAPLDHLKAAPMLYISGRGQLLLSDKERERLADFMHAGGFVLVEACEGDQDFDRSFRAMMGVHFPNDELSPLEKDHPIYTCHFNVPVVSRPRLEAVQGPCWMSLLYAPGGISCSWDVDNREDVNFKLGINILAYVTGMEKLEDKLAAQEKSHGAPSRPEELTKFSGAFVVGQLVHPGNWKTHSAVWPRVLSKVNKEAGIELFSSPVSVNPVEDSLFKAHLLSITGTGRFHLSDDAQRKLKEYVQRGGFIYGEAACGSQEFDESFRALVTDLFPDHRLEEVPPGHPLWKLGRQLEQVSYSAVVTRQNPDLKRPFLEQIELDGRTVLVYSRYDLGSAVAGHPCFSCPAVFEPSASELLLKVILYALAG